MFFRAAAERRPAELGPFPMEKLLRAPHLAERERKAARREREQPFEPLDGPLGAALDHYRALIAAQVDEEAAPASSAIPDDREARARDLFGFAYFMDASQIAACAMPASAWLGDASAAAHGDAVVLLVEEPRAPAPSEPGHGWCDGAGPAIAALRAAEIAVCLARHLRAMGFAARAHVEGASAVDRERLAVLAGIAIRSPDGLRNPFLDRFAIAAITTDYALPHQAPLAPQSLNQRGARYYWGWGGARSGRERARRAARPLHLSAYPMERIRRVDAPTTRIDATAIPRVPKRSSFFSRAAKGDLGERTRLERTRFATKHPAAFAMTGPMRAMTAIQDGPIASVPHPKDGDARANSDAVKALGHMLGADLVGICEAPAYAWYSHQEDGTPIAPYHRYAVVMLIDQGFDTMEGGSGDDWISGAQSMRSYLRGAEIAGVMAAFLRGRGHEARAQTNLDSDVLHIPLVLLAGLGELSRIGELVLNPFVGPRFKSVVLTTDLPLHPDRPIDFGLQAFCGACKKCARECPCDAIPMGGKVLFNGYEIWKPDVERCARYRLTNPKGSACGRCMKTCPLNKVVDRDGSLFHRLESWARLRAGALAPWAVNALARLDDAIGAGRRNAVKKWWFDLEIVQGRCAAPRLGANAREIDPARLTDPKRQRVAIYPAHANPPAGASDPFPPDRKKAMADGAALLEKGVG